jgi:hypothetical protein
MVLLNEYRIIYKVSPPEELTGDFLPLINNQLFNVCHIVMQCSADPTTPCPAVVLLALLWPLIQLSKYSI